MIKEVKTLEEIEKLDKELNFIVLSKFEELMGCFSQQQLEEMNRI